MDRIERLNKILQELHDIANSYAGEKTGTEATLLHLASGNIHKTINSLNGEQPIDQHEIVKTYIKWSDAITLLASLKI